MLSLRSILLFGLPLVSLCSAQSQQKPNEADSEIISLNELVNLLPEESVKAALHDNLAQYRDGVYEHGKNAIEAIHNDDPQLATKLVDQVLQQEIERQELRKRQNSNATSSTVITTSSATVVTKKSTTITSKKAETTTKTQVVTSSTPGQSTGADSSTHSTIVITSTSTVDLGSTSSVVVETKTSTKGTQPVANSTTKPTKGTQPVASSTTKIIQGTTTVVPVTSSKGPFLCVLSTAGNSQTA